MFVVGNQAAVDTWGDYCYDLTGTPIAGELTTDAYNLYDADGKLCSIGYCYESVSYTHLDVYKRQELLHHVELVALGLFADALEHGGGEFIRRGSGEQIGRAHV